MQSICSTRCFYTVEHNSTMVTSNTHPQALFFLFGVISSFNEIRIRMNEIMFSMLVGEIHSLCLLASLWSSAYVCAVFSEYFVYEF